MNSLWHQTIEIWKPQNKTYLQRKYNWLPWWSHKSHGRYHNSLKTHQQHHINTWSHTLFADISNFYLNIPMDHYKYIQLPFEIIPQEIIDGYNLTDISHNGKVYIDIWKVMFGLLQAGRIAYGRLKIHLEKHRYQPVKFTTRLWTHKSRPVSFTLIVDDFGIKCVGNKNAEHLIQALQWLYKITINLYGRFYSALTFKCNHKDKHVYISKPC